MDKVQSPILQVKDLSKFFPVVRGIFGRIVGQIRAVDRVSFELAEGECLGLVGESGSGKTTLGRTILRAIRPTSGRVLFRTNEGIVDLAQVSQKTLKGLRHHLQMIFQDPYASLNPRMTVLDIVGEPLLVNGMTNRIDREGRVRELLEQVGLKPHFLRRYPHAFSGGQRQRIGIARALALHPRLIVADEPVSSLDVSVQSQVLNLLHELQLKFRLTTLFIAHDLSVVRHISDRVAVMYGGQLVELADVDRLFNMPGHPYSEALLSSVLVPQRQRKTKPIFLSGEVADPGNLPTGCIFHPRCRYAESRCREEVPQFLEIEPEHFVRCHLGKDLSLVGLED